MSGDWEDEHFEPNFGIPVKTDKWEGEDEEDVKDSWEDEDAEKKPEVETAPTSEVKAYQKKKKKKLNEKIIAEKEAARAREEAESFLTPEEKVAEKLKRQELQESADLELAKQAFGTADQQPVSGLDAMCPETDEDFLEFKDALLKKITQFDKSPNYCGFLDRLFTELVIPLETDDMKKINSSINNLFHEKQRQQKQEQDKKKKKKGRAVIRAERDTDYGDLMAATEYYDEEELI